MEQRVVLHGGSGTIEVHTSFLGTDLHGIRDGETEFSELAVPDDLWGDVDPTLPPLQQVMALSARQPVGDRLFIDAIPEDRPVSPSFYDGLKAQEVLDAALESHQKGSRVSLSR